jgi:Cof subfamily protein (haloacid dehalogenase superfamily)
VLRLVATDLDGTLLLADGTVSGRTREALEELERRGVAVVFVTGRPIRWMDDLWEHVGAHGLAICSNGGIVYDVRERAIRIARTIPVEVALEVGAVLRKAIPGTTFAVEKTDGYAKEPEFMPRLPPPPDLTVAPFEEIVDERTVKLLARHEELGPEAFWEAVESQVGTLVETTWSSTGALVEISGAGVTKASTLAMLCAQLGIAAEEVVAFGDMPNDLAMLRWAGTAYAMANAHPTVLAMAGLVAPANLEDGVASTVERLFGL